MIEHAPTKVLECTYAWGDPGVLGSVHVMLPDTHTTLCSVPNKEHLKLVTQPMRTTSASNITCNCNVGAHDQEMTALFPSQRLGLGMNTCTVFSLVQRTNYQLSRKKKLINDL